MAYYKNSLKEKAQKFEFAMDSYSLSDEITSEYKNIKSLFFKSVDGLIKYEKKDEYKRKIDEKKISLNDQNTECIQIMKDILAFYDSSDKYITVLMNEVFKKNVSDKMEKTKEIYVLLNKVFKMFFIFDIKRNRHCSAFNDFCVMKMFILNEKHLNLITNNDITRISSFMALSMPMAHLFVSYFVSDSKEVYTPTILRKKGNLHLSDEKKEHLYFLCCLMCKYDDLSYCLIYFCGLFNRFFNSGYLNTYIELLEEQKQAYYEGILTLN